MRIALLGLSIVLILAVGCEKKTAPAPAPAGTPPTGQAPEPAPAPEGDEPEPGTPVPTPGADGQAPDLSGLNAPAAREIPEAELTRYAASLTFPGATETTSPLSKVKSGRGAYLTTLAPASTDAVKDWLTSTKQAAVVSTSPSDQGTSYTLQHRENGMVSAITLSPTGLQHEQTIMSVTAGADTNAPQEHTPDLPSGGQ